VRAPLAWAWQQAAANRTNATGTAAVTFYYAAHALLCLRPAGADGKWTETEMAARAARLSLSPEDFLSMWSDLCEDALPKPTPGIADAIGDLPALSPLEKHEKEAARATRLLGLGESRKAWGVFKGGTTTDQSSPECMETLATLTPQRDPPRPMNRG